MKYLALLLLILVACAAPTRPTPQTSSQPQEANIDTMEQVTRPSQNFTPEPTPQDTKVPLSPLENIEYVPDPYSSIGCEQLLTSEQFANVCQKNAEDFVVTSKIGTRNCLVSIRDRQNERRTAGLTLTGFEDAEHARNEFERRAQVLGRNLTKLAGEQSYGFTQLDRELLTFLRGEYIIEVGVDKRLCNSDEIPALAKSIDQHFG